MFHVSAMPGIAGERGEVAEFDRFANHQIPCPAACARRFSALHLSPLSHMINWLIKKVIGSKNARMIKTLRPMVERINELEKEFQELSDDALRAKTLAWKERLAAMDDYDEQQRFLHEILPEGFAVVKNAARRLTERKHEFTVCDQPGMWAMIHFDVQLIGGICLHRGMIAEMATGEGKTLGRDTPALSERAHRPGRPSRHDKRLSGAPRRRMDGPALLFLGLTTGILQHDQSPDVRRQMYACDITYGMNSEFGFDYLRDNGMATSKEQQVQRGYHFAIVDEVDSILIDEARTPLIISGPATVSTHQYDKFRPLVDQVVKKQTMLCNRLVSDAEELWKQDKKDEFGTIMFKVKLGQPRNKGFLRAMEEPDKRRAIDKAELSFFGDTRKEELYRSRKNFSSPSMNGPTKRICPNRAVTI